MAKLGSNPEALDHLAARFRHATDEMIALRAAVDRRLSSAHWQGPERAQFNARWQHLRNQWWHVIVEFRALDDRLNHQASEQRRASAAAGGRTRSPGSRSAPRGWRDAPTVFGWGSYLDRVGGLKPGTFEILQTSVDPPKYVVLLRGIDGMTLSHDHLQDLGGANAARLGYGNEYAERVKAELERAGIPSGADVMLVGHSYGSITAMDIARDSSFNNTSGDGYHVNVTHVVAAGAGVNEWVDDVPGSTKVLSVVNRSDVVATAMEVAGDGDMSNAFESARTTAQAIPGGVERVWRDMENLVGGHKVVNPEYHEVSPGRYIYEFSAPGGSKNLGHDTSLYSQGIDSNGGGPVDEWLDDASRHYLAGNPTTYSTVIELPDHRPEFENNPTF